MAAELPIVFECEGEQLAGVLHLPSGPCHRGVVVVVGGPQYRIGSHRQFLLLGRELAHRGIACLRFDYRGMGDSDGDPRSFEVVRDDIRAAVDALESNCPGIRHIALWGLCDGASAALMYAPEDERVDALILLNPWVRSEQTMAKAYVRGYYFARVLSADFWKRVLTGKVMIGKSLGQAIGHAAKSLQTQPRSAQHFTQRMVDAAGRFRGRVLVILSGRDLTADEFEIWRSAPERARSFAEPKLSFVRLADANHTFATAQWRNEVSRKTVEWLSAVT